MSDSGGFPKGFEGHRRERGVSGQDLTPAERLRWLEETMATLRRWQGRARGARLVLDAEASDGQARSFTRTAARARSG